MMMRSITFSGLVSAAVLAAGCGGPVVLSSIPNEAPIAVAAIFDAEGLDAGSAQFLGYTIAGEVATLDGSLSRDNEGPIETYTWTFDALPDDSLLTSEDLVPAEDNPETEDVNEAALLSFTPDALGTYRISLVVTDNDEEPSEPSLVFVQAVPPSGLRVRLDWPETGADLDVHLTTPGGTYFDYENGTDCFSWNPNPDWGDGSLALDNPELEGDADGVGAGPYRESIFLDTPADTEQEEYLIRVHYYSDHNELLGGSTTPATPTLQVRVLDNVITEISPSAPLLKGDVWVVGKLSWPDRVFSSINSVTDHDTLGGPAYQE